MFFFQDDIGILIQLASIPFPQILFEQQAGRFLPIFRLFSLLEFKLFGLEFTYYVLVAFLIHLLNCFLLWKLSFQIVRNKYFSWLAVSLFAVNLTHVESLLWWSAHGELLAMTFLATAFFLWYRFVTTDSLRALFLSIPLLLFSGFTYGVGVGLGIIFAAITYIYKSIAKNNQKLGIFLYSGVGIACAFGGIVVAKGTQSQFVDPILYVAKYVLFVVAGVSRGVVGRLFFPGFDPRHFEIIPSLISFLPFLLFLALYVSMFRNIRTKGKRIVLLLLVMVVYPYLWAGILRAQFGLKQALAERYAYVSLFFFSILFSYLLSKLTHEGFIRSKWVVTTFVASILVLQSFVFHLKSVDFEVRPQKTKKYMEDLTEVVHASDTVINLPLPSYINQPYHIKDLVPVITVENKYRFIDPKHFVCDNTTKEFLRNSKIYEFYLTQSSDWKVRKEFSKRALYECHRDIQQSNKRI